MTGVISLVNNDIPARTGGKITDKLQAIRVRQEIYSFLDVAQSWQDVVALSPKRRYKRETVLMMLH